MNNSKKLVTSKPQLAVNKGFEAILEAEIKKLEKKAQDGYTQGMINGSHMQCSTILDLYEKEYNEKPEEDKTLEYLQSLVHKIFDFCRKGCSTNTANTIKGFSNTVIR